MIVQSSEKSAKSGLFFCAYRFQLCDIPTEIFRDIHHLIDDAVHLLETHMIIILVTTIKNCCINRACHTIFLLTLNYYVILYTSTHMSRVCNLVLLNYQTPYRLLKNVYKPRYRSSSKMRISLYLFCSLCSFWYPYNINHFPSSKDASYISRTTRAVLMYLWLKAHLFGRLFSLAAQIREWKQRLCRIFIKVCFFHGSAIGTVNIYQRGAQFVHRDMNDLFNVELIMRRRRLSFSRDPSRPQFHVDA